MGENAGCGLSQVARIEGGVVIGSRADGGFGDLGIADVTVEGGRFGSVASPFAGVATGADGERAAEGEVVDARGGYVIPGLLDLHFHGAVGEDFSDGSADGLHAIAAYEAGRGVTTICPASMTLPEDVLTTAFANAAAFRPEAGEAELVGINMEGPYISPDKVGAQNPAYVRPASVEEFDRLQGAANGLVKLVDVAPEQPGNLDFIAAVHDRVRVSLAHMCADYDTARAAFAAGARHVTHLYNAMPGLHHRQPGPIAAAEEFPGVTAEIIADGVHVRPVMVRLAFEMFGCERMILISDSLRACGLGEGTFTLGGQEFTVHGAEARIANGSLAGSVSDLMACMTNAVRTMGLPLADAVRAASLNPARALGVDGDYGTVAAGKVANAVVLNDDLTVRHVVLRGRLLR